MRNPSSSSSSSSLSHKSRGGPTPCCSKEGLKRGPWTADEDAILADYVQREGEGRWRTLPQRAGLLRCGKSCRLRWMNYLRPSVKRGPIAPDEEDLILRLHRLLGNRWSLIAGRIPGRTDNEIKNYWNTHLSKKLIRQGINPQTHQPLACSNPNPSATPNPDTNPSSAIPPATEENGGVFYDGFDSYLEGIEFNYEDMWRNPNGNFGPRILGKNGEEGIGCCSHEMFSFLDSLINDEVEQQQTQIQGSSSYSIDNNDVQP